MRDDVSREIEDALASAASPLTVAEIAGRIQLDPDAIAQSIWASPDRFAWQPGGRWTLATAKGSIRPPAAESDHQDTRPAVLAPRDGIELEAMTLANGAVLRVTRRPLDTAALFSVRARGQDLQLVLNSSHEVFESLPMPFENEADGDYKRLVELLLTAWTVHEAAIPSGTPKRALEDARLMWGRSVLDLLHAKP